MRSVEAVAQDLLRPRRAPRRELVRHRRSHARSPPGAAISLAVLRARSSTTTMSTPSSARWRRSRSDASRTSPTASPSTKVTPACDLVDDPRAGRRRARRPSRSPRSTIRSGGTPASRASRACAASIRNSPCTGMTVARTQEPEHHPELLGVAVAGRVNGRDLLMEHLGTGLREPVDRVVHLQLVARHGLRRDDHRVALARRARAGGRRRQCVRAPRAARPGCRCRGSSSRAARGSSRSPGRTKMSSGTSM